MDWLNFFRFVGYIALIFGAICTVGVDYMKVKGDETKERQQQSQLNELSTDIKASKKLLEPFSDLATKLYPHLDQKDALEKLRDRMDSLDREIVSGKEKVVGLSSQLDIEKKTIKTFDVTVSIEFSGVWKEIPYPLWWQPAKPEVFLRWKDSSKKLPDLEFATSRLNYETISPNIGLFKNTLTVLPGQFPLGELTDILKAYDEMEFNILLTQPEKLLGPVITFNKVDIIFSINGTKRGELHENTPMSQDYSQGLRQLIPGKVMYLTPSISLNGRPVDVLKFRL
jgi:hypothetical protein